MKENSVDIKYCINLAIDNAEKRIKLLEKGDQKCILEEYKEWLKESIDYQSIRNNFLYSCHNYIFKILCHTKQVVKNVDI